MKYLVKNQNSPIIAAGWTYATASHRPKIREQLLKEQRNFCAYTERYIAPVDACEIEHFDDRKKATPNDSYWNWYAVHRWINLRKRAIATCLPILMPYDTSLSQRIHYYAGAFQPIKPDDREAINLIQFLGWNDPTLANYRQKHIARIRDLRDRFFSDDPLGFQTYITDNPENLSFLTALEAELKLNLNEGRSLHIVAASHSETRHPL